MKKKYAIGIDIGGTNIAIGLINESNQLIYKDFVETPKNGTALEIINCIISQIKKMEAEMNVTKPERRWIL